MALFPVSTWRIPIHLGKQHVWRSNCSIWILHTKKILIFIYRMERSAVNWSSGLYRPSIGKLRDSRFITDPATTSSLWTKKISDLPISWRHHLLTHPFQWWPTIRRMRSSGSAGSGMFITASALISCTRGPLSNLKATMVRNHLLFLILSSLQ